MSQKINIGDKMFKKTTANKDVLYEGTVVYVHPDNRFYTMEFEMGGGKFRESYQLKEH